MFIGKWSMVLVCLLGLQATVLAEPAVLVEQGRPNAVIIVDEQASSHTRQAAELLLHYVERMSDVRLPIEHQRPTTQQVMIWIGEHPELTELYQSRPELDVTLTKYDETFRHIDARQVIIRGRDRMVAGEEVEVGSFLATQRFIMEQLGVRWLWPGELGTDIPRSQTIAVSPATIQYAPQVVYREVRMRHYRRFARQIRDAAELIPDIEKLVPQMDQQVRTWLQRHNVEQRGSRAGTQPIGGSRPVSPGHYFPHWYESYFEDHPEWFALQPDGTRGTFPTNTRNMKLCVSNPQVKEQYIQEALRYFERYPYRDSLSVAPNDNGYRGYCVCENCAAWDSPNAPWLEAPLQWANYSSGHRALTDRYVRFWNEIITELRERLPDRDIMLDTLAYHAYRPAPVDVSLSEHVTIGYVGIFRRDRSRASREHIQQQLENWKSWADRAGRMNWRPNMHIQTHGDPYIMMSRYGEVMNFLADNKLTAINITDFTNWWATKGPQYYVTTAMAWDPHADVNDILDDYYARAFGPGAKAMANYYRLFENLYYYLADTYDTWSDRSDTHLLYRNLHISGRERGNISEYFDFTEEELASRRPVEMQARRYFEQAQAAVADADEKYRQRLEYVGIGLAYVESHLDTLQAMADLRDNPSDAEAYRRAQEAYDRREELLVNNFDNFALNILSFRARQGRRQLEFGPPSTFVQSVPANSVPLSGPWQFRFDPDDVGRDQQWYALELDMTGWQPIRIYHWNGDTPGREWFAKYGEDYLGAAWYRTTFTVDQPVDQIRQVHLHFGAVDEQAWVYVNGQYVGEHTVESQGQGVGRLYTEPFTITVATEHLSPDGKNLLAVRVHASVGQGGIWRPVWLSLE